jgi:hypothetical protein
LGLKTKQQAAFRSSFLTPLKADRRQPFTLYSSDRQIWIFGTPFGAKRGKSPVIN